MSDVRYRVMADNDLMQICDGQEVGPLGVRLAPDTAALFAAAPEMQDRITELEADRDRLAGEVERLRDDVTWLRETKEIYDRTLAAQNEVACNVADERDAERARADAAEARLEAVRELAEKALRSKFASDLANDILDAIK